MPDKLWSSNFILAFCANLLMYFAFYLLAPILPLYLTNYIHLSASEVGTVLAIYTLATLLSRSTAGYMVDKFSRKALFIIGLLLFTLSFLGYILAAGMVAFIVLRFLHGLTWGITTVAGNTVAIDIIPSERRGQGIGFYGLSTNLAMAVAPWIATMIYSRFGYTALIATSIISGLLACSTASFMKTKSYPKVEKSPISLDRFILIKALPITMNLVLCAIAYGMIVSYGILYGLKIGIENAGMMFIAMAGGIGVSRVISGRYVDKGYIHITAMLSILLLTLALIFFALIHNAVIFYSMAFLCGVSFGTMIPVFQTLFINIAYHNQRGTANSTYLTSYDIGIGIGMLVGGFMATHAGLYAGFLLCSALCFIAIPYYRFISQPIYEKNKLVNKS